MPVRSIIARTKFDASFKACGVPESSHAVPFDSIFTQSYPRRRYSLFTSVISYSPLALGFRFSAMSTTEFG